MPQRKAGWPERSAAARTDYAWSSLGVISRLEPQSLCLSRCDEMPSCAARKEEINAVRRENFNRTLTRPHLSKSRFICPGLGRFSEIAANQLAGPIKCAIHFTLEFGLVNQIGPLRKNACDFYGWHIKTPN